jgi:hypothetical protein
MLHITVVFKVNVKNIEWGKCLCKCRAYITVCFQKKIWKISSEVNVYVNVTYNCGSQSKYEKYRVRWMFM